MSKRKATASRKTSETDIKIVLDIDGTGQYKIETGIPFFNHMLELFTKHSLMDIEIQALGDIEIDGHHTVEDVGIVLGNVFKQALGDKKGIKRYASITLPMDESLAEVSLDISGRPFLSYQANPLSSGKVGEFDVELVEEFFRAFVVNAAVTLHIDVKKGDNLHHVAEAIFKATARALAEAVTVNDKVSGIPSTKGVL